MDKITFEVSLPTVTKDSDVEGLANELSNAVYAVAINILERGEMAGILSGNGHHAAQKVAQFASDEVIRRRLDNKKPLGYEESEKEIMTPREGTVCARCKCSKSLVVSNIGRNLPHWDWCHKYMCRITQWKGRCPDFKVDSGLEEDSDE